jgi:hypothetical protein
VQGIDLALKKVKKVFTTLKKYDTIKYKINKGELK